MVIVDNSVVCFSRQLNNGIHIPSYFGQKNDDALNDVMELLKKVASANSIPEELEKRIGLENSYQWFIKGLQSKAHE